MKRLLLILLINIFPYLRSMQVIPIRTPEEFDAVLKPYYEGDQSNMMVAVDIDKTVGEPVGPSGLSDEAYHENKNLFTILTTISSHRPKSQHAISRHGLRQQDYEAMHRETTLSSYDSENKIPCSINKLINNKVLVWLVTNRDTDLNEQTRRQLKDLGIILNDDPKPTDLPHSYSHTFRGKEQTGRLVGRILFCANNAKGPMMAEALNLRGFDPETIVFADDKTENLFSVIDTFPGKVVGLHMQLESPIKHHPQDEKLTRYRPTINVRGHQFVREWIDPSLQRALREGGLHNESATNLRGLGRRRSSDDLSPSSPNSPPPTCPPDPPDLSLLWNTHFKK